MKKKKRDDSLYLDISMLSKKEIFALQKLYLWGVWPPQYYLDKHKVLWLWKMVKNHLKLKCN